MVLGNITKMFFNRKRTLHEVMFEVKKYITRSRWTDKEFIYKFKNVEEYSSYSYAIKRELESNGYDVMSLPDRKAMKIIKTW